MNFTFLPSADVLIHSSSGIFAPLEAKQACCVWCAFAIQAWVTRSQAARDIWQAHTSIDNCIAAGPEPSRQRCKAINERSDQWFTDPAFRRAEVPSSPHARTR